MENIAASGNARERSHGELVSFSFVDNVPGKRSKWERGRVGGCYESGLLPRITSWANSVGKYLRK